jgi:ferredoxin-NADP reductase
VVSLVDDTPSVRSIALDVPGWPGHRPGQHLDVRLTADDGYRAERSYSIANAPEGERVVLTVERLDDGEVSPYLVDELRPGDELELRGPVGGYFVWDGRDGPLLLVGGGSGVVPLMAMLRHRRRAMPEAEMRLVYSVRAADDVIYADELGEETALTFTREPPQSWGGHVGHIDANMFGDAAGAGGIAFACGSNGFVESAAQLLLQAGWAPERIRTERFGPTG